MKKMTVALLAMLALLVSFSIASAGPDDNSDRAWQQEFAVAVETLGLEQAIKNARAEGKTVSQIISASLAAGFGDNFVVTALTNAGVGKAEIVAAAAESGLNMQTVTIALSASGSDADGQQGELGFSQAAASQPLSHPASPVAGGASTPPSVSPSTF